MREPKERETVVVTDVEEEVLPHPTRKVERLDERHPQDVAIKAHRSRHVARHHRDVVDTAQLELLVGPHRAATYTNELRPEPASGSRPEPGTPVASWVRR